MMIWENLHLLWFHPFESTLEIFFLLCINVTLVCRQRAGVWGSLHGHGGRDAAQQLPAEAGGRGQGRVRGQDAAQHRPPPGPAPHHRQGVQGKRPHQLWRVACVLYHVEPFYNLQAASFETLYGRGRTKTKILSITGTCSTVKNIFPTQFEWSECTLFFALRCFYALTL